MRTRSSWSCAYSVLACAVGLVGAACSGDGEPCPLEAVAPSPPERQFDTNPFSNLNRPDSAIAVGPTAVVTAVNFQMQVQDLDGSNPTTTPIDSTFFTGDPTNSIGDPRLIYDATDDRFIMSFLGFDYPGQMGPGDTGDSWCDLAVSATNDPRGAWNKYSFQVFRNGSEQMDFDSLGYDSQAIYITAHMRDAAGSVVLGNRIVILDKATALAGGTLTPTFVDDVLLPNGVDLADIIKPVEPLDAAALAGPAQFLTESGTDALALYTLTDPLGTHTLTSITIPIAPWAAAGTAPQKGGPPELGQDAGPVLQKTTMRNGVIWTAHSPSASGIAGERAGIRLYEIDPVAGMLLGQHTISDPSIWFYLPAVVPDASGNVAVVFAGSDATHFASIFYSRLLVGQSDFEVPAQVAAGTTTYGDDTWGDYFDAAPDPTNGNFVWLHGELPVTATTWKMHAARVSTTQAANLKCNPTVGGDAGEE